MTRLPPPNNRVGYIFFQIFRKIAVASAILFFCVSCVTTAVTEEQFRETIVLPQAVPYSIISYMDTETGDLPAWLVTYLGAASTSGKDTAGLLGVEALAEYAGRYVFIIEQRGAALSALEKWKAYFRINQDFSSAVFLRMYARLLSESEGRPDYFFGDFFEIFLKKIAGSSFSGASFEDFFWVKTAFQRATTPSFTPEEPEPEETLPSIEYETEEEYRYYILTTINRADLQREIRTLFAESRDGLNLEKFHANAVDRLEAALFAGF